VGCNHLVATDQACHQPAYRDWVLRPRVATTALQQALAVCAHEHLSKRRTRDEERPPGADTRHSISTIEREAVQLTAAASGS
jgi:hypothetical protein